METHPSNRRRRNQRPRLREPPTLSAQNDGTVAKKKQRPPRPGPPAPCDQRQPSKEVTRKGGHGQGARRGIFLAGDTCPARALPEFPARVLHPAAHQNPDEEKSPGMAPLAVGISRGSASSGRPTPHSKELSHWRDPPPPGPPPFLPSESSCAARALLPVNIATVPPGAGASPARPSHVRGWGSME